MRLQSLLCKVKISYSHTEYWVLYTKPILTMTSSAPSFDQPYIECVYKPIHVCFNWLFLCAGVSMHTVNSHQRITYEGNYLYTLHTAWVSWHGFQLASKMTTRFAPTRFTPRLPARVDTRNSFTWKSYKLVLHLRCTFADLWIGVETGDETFSFHGRGRSIQPIVRLP